MTSIDWVGERSNELAEKYSRNKQNGYIEQANNREREGGREERCLFVCFYMKMNFAYRFQIFQFYARPNLLVEALNAVTTLLHYVLSLLVWCVCVRVRLYRILVVFNSLAMHNWICETFIHTDCVYRKDTMCGICAVQFTVHRQQGKSKKANRGAYTALNSNWFGEFK